MHRLILPLTCILVLALALGGCGLSKTQKGALLGAGAGAAAGAAVSDDDTKGAAVGAAAGALIGGLIGSYLDKQADELEDIEGATVTREGDELLVTFDSAILFDTDSSSLKADSRQQLAEMAGVMVRYPDTDIIVLGHTDSTGQDAYNQTLSERRAASVSGYLQSQGVTVGRIRARGFGESVPVGDNGTAAGRQMNRRVEVNIQVNEEFRRRAAEQG
jgi:outer membrane protein OmpA-like peptidoglycan-associated protein